MPSLRITLIGRERSIGRNPLRCSQELLPRSRTMPGITANRARCASGYGMVGVDTASIQPCNDTACLRFASAGLKGERYMQYTHLGRTGLIVSRLCLGTMNFGPETSEADSFNIMDRALEQEINFFDTANVYGAKKGEGVTEQIIGRWLAQGGGRREQIVLATKVYGGRGAGSNDSRLSAYHLRRAPEHTHQRCQTEPISLYQLPH